MAKSKKIRSHEVTFEGKNIHFSPLDNKPLCSFSNKLCRQRRLNGFAFCIRHILEDKSSPFKQCDYVTRNNSQRCLNAIPLNQERGYCHSHMQVAGIIPKTERKVKPVQGSSSGSNSAAPGKDAETKKENKKKVSAPIRADKNPLPTTPTTPSTNGKGKRPPQSTRSKGKFIPTLITDTAPKIVKNGQPVPKESPLADLNGKSTMVSLTKGKPSVTKNSEILKKPTKTAKSKPVSFVGSQVKQENLKNQVTTFADIPSLSQDLHFEQLRTLNISDFHQAVNTDAKLVKNESLSINIPIISPIDGLNDFVLIPPFLQTKKLNGNLNGEMDLKKLENGKCVETRQEFLSRVRSAFKSHYKMFRRAYKQNENQDDNKYIRESLLSCVLIDPKASVKVLINSEVENNCKVEEKLFIQNGDKSSHSSLINFQSNNSISATVNNKTHHNGISCIQSNFLRDFDESLSSEHFKESRFCDSSPWMNGGIHDLPNGNGNWKKGRSYNQASKLHLNSAQSHFTDGKVPSYLSKRNQKSACSADINLNNDFSLLENQKSRNSSNQLLNGMSLMIEAGVSSHLMKKRRVDLDSEFDDLEHNLGLDLDGTSERSSHLLCPSQYSTAAHFETVLNSVSSSDTAETPDGVITDASFDSPFDHSTSSQPDCDFSDDVDDLEKTFELQIDPEIAHQASRLLENNEFTEDDFNELFPETRSLNDHKLGGDLGIDFTTTFDGDIDYTLFANIFPNFRSNNTSEVISVSQTF